MATPEDEIPLNHLPLDVLRRTIARREAEGRAAPARAVDDAPGDVDGEVDALLASVGLRVRAAPAGDLEPLRGELARRIDEGREVARQRSALYRSHRAIGLQQYRGKVTRTGLERFILAAGERIFDEVGTPPTYLLVPPRIFHRHLIGVYNIIGAAINGQPLVLTTPFGPVKIVESALVAAIMLA